MADEVPPVTLVENEHQQKQQQRKKSAGLDKWSTRVEDLVDGGDEDGALQLLEKVVESLQMRDDVSTNLGLAAALNEMGRIYTAQGLSLKSDSVLNSALLIKAKNAAQRDSWEGKADNVSLTGLNYSEYSSRSEPREKFKDSSQDDLQIRSDCPGEPSTAGEREEDWESLLDGLPKPLEGSPSTIHKEWNSKENTTANKRGRGSFTYGGAGLYSDHLEAVTARNNDSGNGSNESDILADGGANHVLVLSFSPKMKTGDLEKLVKPFLQKGSCSIRWIDDTKALAVFSSPALARDAMDGIKDPRFNVGTFSEANGIVGMLPSMKDLAPPAPRPASSARVAQRMIASALSKQGVHNARLARNQASALEIEKQERQRKDRLQSRAKLRDEAWGPDDA